MRVCTTCGHPLAWHGDRAIAACDGGLTMSEISPGTMRPYAKKKPGEGVALCSCSGWVESSLRGCRTEEA